MQLIYVDDTSLNAWRRDDLTSAVAIFSQETQDADYHRLANLALVRARLEQWESAEQDARASIEIRPTILAYIAVSIALGGQGQLAAAKQEFNQAFLCHEPKNACLLLLIKSIIIFVAGDRDEATRRVGDLVQACEEADQPLCRAVQAQMQFLVGQTALDEKDSEEALNLFASAGASAPFLKLPELDTITLIFGWDFDSLLLGIRQRTCEALYMASRMSEAAESLKILLDEFGEEIRASVRLNDWYQNFSRKCAKAAQDTPIDNSKHAKGTVNDSRSSTPPSDNDSALQVTLDSLFHVSAIVIGLARDSRKTIESIKLRKNDELLRDVQKTVNAGGVHREEFHPPLVLGHEEHFSVSVSCSWPTVLRQRVADVLIDLNIRDMECIRDAEGVRSYRKKAQKVEVVTGRHLSGVGKSSLLHRVFGVEGIHTSKTQRGIAEIDQEFISSTNERFVVHDSLGFEGGDEGNMEIVKDFVARKKAMPHLNDQLHAIWLCLETPYAGGRLLDGGVEEFLKRRQDILGQIPLVVVLTKVDQLDIQLELDPPANEDLDKHFIGPLHKAAGSDITHVLVSVQDGYSESLSNLVGAMDKNMAKYHTDEAPRVVASIAQRISIKEKIELSIAYVPFEYWNMLLNSPVFRDHPLQECLQVIRQDIITVWNFNDPDRHLMDDNIIGALLRTDNLGDASETPLNMALFASLLASSLESGDMSVVAPLSASAISVAQTMYTAYDEKKKDVKILMAYIIDLVCFIQAVFLLTSGGRVTVTPEIVNLALQAYDQPRKIVHLLVDAFDGKLGVLPGGRDHALDKIEELIWRYSIADHEIKELRQRIDQVLPSGSL
ncbi:hypothetical protein L210DRAFT_3525408 [Boletus edulis BED1]|uniref:G domain-containing protein n=1 Tax=Boletus edulis BED1 TaxID=1328754 RepID=A0AAD4GJ56_BOLED|nr:hypothetical protein L210DRAFT_3525408 [Boletus edulis BED1]